MKQWPQGGSPLRSSFWKKREILNSQFSGVFTKEDLENFPEMGSDPIPGFVA